MINVKFNGTLLGDFCDTGKGWYWLHQSLFLPAYEFETQTTTVEGDLLLCSEKENFDKDENDKMEILFYKQMTPLVARRSEM